VDKAQMSDFEAYDRLPAQVRAFIANSVSPPNATLIEKMLRTMPVDQFMAGIRAHELRQHLDDARRGEVAPVPSGQFQLKPRRRRR
jgi:hypothetical protein